MECVTNATLTDTAIVQRYFTSLSEKYPNWTTLYFDIKSNPSTHLRNQCVVKLSEAIILDSGKEQQAFVDHSSGITYYARDKEPCLTDWTSFCMETHFEVFEYLHNLLLTCFVCRDTDMVITLLPTNDIIMEFNVLAKWIEKDNQNQYRVILRVNNIGLSVLPLLQFNDTEKLLYALVVKGIDMQIRVINMTMFADQLSTSEETITEKE